MPLETQLLQAARRAGCATVDGGHMNVGQATRGFKLFTGLEADTARMEAHFRKLVSGGGLSDFVQLLISGTATGAIYALAALGFTLLWQASGTINFAQGEFVMVPAFVTLLRLCARRAAVGRVPDRLRRVHAGARPGLQEGDRRPAHPARRDPLVIATSAFRSA